MKKKQPNTPPPDPVAPPSPDVPIQELLQETLREAVVKIRAQIASGDIVATNMQVLASLSRSLKQADTIDDAELDRLVRALDPAKRIPMLREWQRIDVKRSGLS